MFFTLSWACKRGKKWLKFSHSEWNLGTSYILRCQFSCLSGGRVFVSCRTVQKLFSPSSQFKKKFVLVSGRFRMVFFFFFFFPPSSFENILWWLWLKYTLHCRVADKWRSVCENKIIYLSLEKVLRDWSLFKCSCIVFAKEFKTWKVA